MKGLLFYWFRGGSSLLNSLISEQSVVIPSLDNPTPSRNCRYLITSPPNFLPLEDGYALRRKGKFDVPHEDFIYRMHVGDQVLVPPKVVKLLEPEDKVVMLCRDGRNQIESRRCKVNGAGWRWSQKDRDGFFEEAVAGFCRRADFSLSLQDYFGECYKLIKMEDLVSAPMETLIDLYHFWGVIPSIERLQHQIKILITDHKKRPLSHSSFSSLENLNKRWDSWSQEEIKFFSDKAGEALKIFGYEKS